MGAKHVYYNDKLLNFWNDVEEYAFSFPTITTHIANKYEIG